MLRLLLFVALIFLIIFFNLIISSRVVSYLSLFLAYIIAYFLRFRHFEELHRRLKEFPEYNLHLPPKHFLSTGSDVPIIQERCELLDKYLKVNLTQIFLG